MYYIYIMLKVLKILFQVVTWSEACGPSLVRNVINEADLKAINKAMFCILLHMTPKQYEGKMLCHCGCNHLALI